ncbi:MAG: membrane or secreted protein [Planctomycetota bacterium]
MTLLVAPRPLPVAWSIVLVAMVWCVGLTSRTIVSAEEPSLQSAIDFLPDTAAGVVRVPNIPALCEAWDRTTLSGLADDDALEPLLEANFGNAGSVWKMIDERVGVRPKDFYELASGELVAAWLSYASRRRPSALIVVADIRGNEAKAADVIDRIDQDMTAQQAVRRDVQRAGETVRVYTPKAKPGQLKIEQIVVSLTKERLIASDYDEIVLNLLDAIESGGGDGMLDQAELRQLVTNRSYEQLEQDKARLPAEWRESVVEWFAKPLEVGRIIRDVAQVDRGNQVKIIDLLEEQGFDAIEGAGGVVAVGTDAFDLLHRGYIHAPPIPGEPDRYRLAARMLQFPNSDMNAIPRWVPDDVASVSRMNWKLSRAFWASETLVDAALDSEIFRPSIDGIRDDEDGPQIDLEANVLPNLNDHVLILTDTTVPSSVESDRILLAIAIKDYETIANAVRKAMEVEPDVFQIESVPGIEIWKVQRGEGGELDEEFFQDFGFDDEVADEQEPLLNTWSIAAIPQGPAMTSAYLVFASHLELLEKVANRMADAAPTAPLVDAEEFQTLIGHLSRLGVNEQSIQRIVRFRYSLRTKYELLRKGELRQSDSILSTLVRRAIDEAEFEEEFDRPNQSKWPEFAAVEKYFRNAVSFVETTDSGWTLNGFLLR